MNSSASTSSEALVYNNLLSRSTRMGGIRLPNRCLKLTLGAEGFLRHPNSPFYNCTTLPSCVHSFGLGWGSRRPHPPAMISSYTGSCSPPGGPGPCRGYFPAKTRQMASKGARCGRSRKCVCSYTTNSFCRALLELAHLRLRPGRAPSDDNCRGFTPSGKNQLLNRSDQIGSTPTPSTK